jgi:hypothetical protein
MDGTVVTLTRRQRRERKRDEAIDRQIAALVAKTSSPTSPPPARPRCWPCSEVRLTTVDWLTRAEAVIDTARVAERIEALLPTGGRPRQLAVRTLLIGIYLAIADHRPAHLTRIHHALVALPDTDRRRLGVDIDWPTGPHTLTYRQVERTFGLVTTALAKPTPDGTPSDTLNVVVDTLLEASTPTEHKDDLHRVGRRLE